MINSNPSALHSCKMLTISPPPTKIAYYTVPKLNLYSSNWSYNISKRIHYHRTSFNGSTRAGRMAVACSGDDSAPRDEPRALETVLKLYEAIKNQNVQELSDIIAEECLCVSNIVSTSRPILGKKQVLVFFSSLMKSLGNNLEFVVQQTSDDGMVVGVSWKLECNKVHLPLGKGFSVHMCHVYQGKVMIKNVEIFLEPIVHLEPLRLKVIPLVMISIEKLNPQALLKNKTTKAIVVFITLFSLATILLFLYKYRTPT